MQRTLLALGLLVIALPCFTEQAASSPLLDEYQALYQESSAPCQWQKWAADASDPHRAGLAEWMLGWQGMHAIEETSQWREPLVHILRAATLLQSDEPISSVLQMLPEQVVSGPITIDYRYIKLPLFLFARDRLPDVDRAWVDRKMSRRHYTDEELENGRQQLAALTSQIEKLPYLTADAGTIP